MDAEGNETLVTPGAASSTTPGDSLVQELQEMASTSVDLPVEVIEARLREEIGDGERIPGPTEDSDTVAPLIEAGEVGQEVALPADAAPGDSRVAGEGDASTGVPSANVSDRWGDVGALVTPLRLPRVEM